MTRRWLIVLAVAAALVVTPIAVAVRPNAAVVVSPAVLAQRMQASTATPWSGLVATTGGLALPRTDSFAGLADLLAGDNDLRVWWRSAAEWRIDRMRSTGETDLVRASGYTFRWEFESRRATASPNSTIRLPDVSDILPSTLAAAVLQGARPGELSAIAGRRIAGIDAPGLRLTPADAAGTVSRVDIWADPATGLPLRVELAARGGTRPALTTAVTELTVGPPAADRTRFDLPADADFDYEQSVDVAAEANALTDVDLPTTLAGLPTRNGADPGAVGTYGRGPATLIVVPLRAEVAGPVRGQLRDNGAQRTAVGFTANSGLVTVLVTSGRLDPKRAGGGFLLAGTLDADTMRRAAEQLLGIT